MIEAVVWSKHSCPFCVTAKETLTKLNIVYEERIVGGGWTKEQLLKEVPDAKTVPQIFIRGKYIGGCDDLMTYIETHNLTGLNEGNL